MSSGGERSPISLESDSDTSRNRGHPLDAVIQKAIHRQQSPANVTSAPVNAGKRKRDPTPPDVDVISLHSTSSEDDTYGSDRDDAENGNSDIPLGPTKTASVAPIGVTVVEEGENTRNAEVQRLLRRGRYFDDNVEELGAVCFKCGLRGHKIANCTNERKEMPCGLCAQYGHNKSHCPSLLCYKCQRRGHIARECPNAGRDAAKVCLRCGKGKCPAAGTLDYHRAEGACTEPYMSADLALVRCYTCNRMGHLCCAAGPQEPPEPSCHNCGDVGHVAADCHMAKPSQVNMERQYGSRQAGRQDRFDSGRPSQDRWSARSGPAGGYDRWSNGASYDVYNGASMATGNGYASRVSAFAERTRGRDEYATPREGGFGPRRGGNRHYPGSEKIHGPPEYARARSPYEEYDRGYTERAPYTVPVSRWRR